MAIEIGRVCIKTAGRDAGNYCTIVDTFDNNLALIDGGTRRRKCNILHLEPTSKLIEISKGASHEAVAEAFRGLNLPVWGTKPKTKQPRPVRQKKVKETVNDAGKSGKGATENVAAPETESPIAQEKPKKEMKKQESSKTTISKSAKGKGA